MPNATPLYDLVLMLSMSADDEQRAKMVSDVETAIAAGDGSVQRRDDWGTRPLTFRIRHEAEAEYHLLQFTGPSSLLESLSHSLRIADDVLRFRIIKVLPGTPAPPDSPPPVVATVAGGSSAPSAPAAGTDVEDED
jgi:small subunit ribosomal protein S6